MRQLLAAAAVVTALACQPSDRALPKPSDRVAQTLSAVELDSSGLPNSVTIMVLPATGDPLTVPMIAMRNTELSAASPFCNLDESPDDVPDTLVNPTIAEFDDPYTSGRVCRVPLPAPLPVGNGYRAVAVFISATCVDELGNPMTNCQGPRSDVGIPAFNVSQVSTCDDAVILDVGDWQRNVPVTGNGRVTYSLLRSHRPVTTLIVMFNGVEQDRLTGSDLRKVAGSYFAVGAVAGSFMLTVEALDADGCSDGATRPMTVHVQ